MRSGIMHTAATPMQRVLGAPTYQRDYKLLLQRDIGTVVNIRAERADETAFYDQHGITHVRYRVPDVMVPDDATLSHAVDWIKAQVDDGRVVLIHCVKGRSTPWLTNPFADGPHDYGRNTASAGMPGRNIPSLFSNTICTENTVLARSSCV